MLVYYYNIDMRILVIEDDRILSSIIKRGLVEEGYAVDTVYDGEEGQYFAENTQYDLIILDIMLPKKDGIQVCRELRVKKVNTPILMLTARDTVDDKVKGLGSGADDYLVKPFAFNELLARIRALLRRESLAKTPLLQVGELEMNTLTREIWFKGNPVELTNKEYVILEYFMRHPNMVISRTMLENHAWDYEFDSISNLIDVYIRKLRRKIGGDGDSPIQTVRGAGYRLRV